MPGSSGGRGRRQETGQVGAGAVSVGDVVLLQPGGKGSQEACEFHQLLVPLWATQRPPDSGTWWPWVLMGTTRAHSLSGLWFLTHYFPKCSFPHASHDRLHGCFNYTDSRKEPPTPKGECW